MPLPRPKRNKGRKKRNDLQDKLKLLEAEHAKNQSSQILQEIKIRSEINDMTSQEIMKKMFFTKE